MRRGTTVSSLLSALAAFPTISAFLSLVNLDTSLSNEGKCNVLHMLGATDVHTSMLTSYTIFFDAVQI
jgi:hypothetical protein